MQVLYPRCAGLDVHKDTIVACVRCVSAPEHHEVRSFESTTSGLLALADWLASHGCTHVAMEATGVYWKPVWHILEGSFELVLANAQHSATCRVARPTSTTRCGFPICSPTG
jgi:transposase